MPEVRKRNRKKQTQTLRERLLDAAHSAREQAEQMPAGRARDLLLRRAEEAEKTAELESWLRAPALHPPT